MGDGHAEDKPRTMPELLIKPKDASDSVLFKPKFSNWIRRAKVPTLILNCSSLNFGHNWQFTANSMGEPPSQVNGEIDINERYRRVYYPDAPTDELKHYRLGYAVAASAGVPGLSEPLTISGLYQNRLIGLLGDGTIDQSLIDQGCTKILWCDASELIGNASKPPVSLQGAMMCAGAILQNQVCGSEYQNLHSRMNSYALDGLIFIHTKKELSSKSLDWINCQYPQAPPEVKSNQTSYGINPELQEKIAAIRTDLGVFGLTTTTTEDCIRH